MINKVILVGNLGKDPEVMNFDSGKKKVSFTMATSESYKDQSGEWIQNTEWHNVVGWGKIVGVITKYGKGAKVYVEGKITTRSWEDQSGEKKYITEINVQTFRGLTGKKEDNGYSDQSQQPQQPFSQPVAVDAPYGVSMDNEPFNSDDLPF